MRKTIVFSLALFFLVSVNISGPDFADGNYRDRVVYKKIYEGNYWDAVFGGFFREPIEIVVFIFADGTTWAYHTQESERIDINVWELDFLFKKSGVEMKEIVLVVHNHATPHPPSEGDRGFFRGMRQRGFRGISLVYYPALKKVKIVE